MRNLPLVVWLVATLAGVAQPPSALHPIPRFPLRAGALAITRPAEAGKPFTVVGERGALFGEQNGTFEAWLHPVKILSGSRIAAEVTAHAAVIEVTPAITTITYSHAAFTVRQRTFRI